MRYRYIPEQLEAINTDTTKLHEFKEDGALKLLFKYAFEPEYKFLLPEGDPPFTPDPNEIGETHGLLKPEIRKLYVYTKENPNMEPFKREMHFIRLLSDIHISEAKILLAIKDQNLGKLYPNITHQLVKEAGLL